LRERWEEKRTISIIEGKTASFTAGTASREKKKQQLIIIKIVDAEWGKGKGGDCL